ncbi:AroB 3-dehydroquinate synthetase [Rhabdaerophilaceae bacterium]
MTPNISPDIAGSQRHTVRVDLGGRSYDILIGRDLLADAGGHIAAFAHGRRVLVITDENVGAIHLAPLVASLEGVGLVTLNLVLPAGEKTKSWPFLELIVERILSERLERGDLVVALGGGVIGDLTGFSAAIARRGMRFVQIPTSLLAQADSSVGGKTGINSPAGKNLVGAFHQPVLVLCDTGTLDSLPLRELRAGYAEVVKYGLIDQRNFFDWLEAGAWRGIFNGGPEREEAVRVACASKAAIVARDEHETGERALLNLGHTFGHALEAITAYASRRLVHGEAVAIGIAMAHRFSVRLGHCTGQDARRVEQHLEMVGLPTSMSAIPDWSASADEMIHAIRQDKKVSQGALTFILTRGLGESFIAKGVDEESLRAFLDDDLRR